LRITEFYLAGQIFRPAAYTNKKLTRRRDSERELSLRRHRTRSTKYIRLVHKFRHRSTRLCVGTQVYQIQWNNVESTNLTNTVRQRKLHRFIFAIALSKLHLLW